MSNVYHVTPPPWRVRARLDVGRLDVLDVAEQRDGASVHRLYDQLHFVRRKYATLPITMQITAHDPATAALLTQLAMHTLPARTVRIPFPPATAHPEWGADRDQETVERIARLINGRIDQ